MYVFKIASLALLVLFAALSHSQNSAISPELFKLSLADLLQIKVRIVSKKEEDFLAAPGVVSVIDKQQIESFGARTVGDVIDRFPGVSKQNLYSIHESYLGLRGQTVLGLDSRILLLINGRPLREYFAGGVNHHIYRGMSVSAIERIEMIRGPGSVLYGSNAFAGLINIVTKKGLVHGDTSVSLTAGSFDTQIGEFNVSLRPNEQVSGFTSLRINHVGGWEYQYTDAGVPAFGVSSTTDQQDNGYDAFSLLSSWQADQYGLDLYYSNMDADSIGADALWPGVITASDRGFLNVYLKQPLTSHWDLRADITYNRTSESYDDLFAKQDIITYNIIYEAALHGSFDEWSYLMGSSANNLFANDKINNSKTDTQWYNFYAQTTYNGFDNLSLVAGLQLNQTADIDVDTSPRVGLVYHFSPKLGAKLLYSEAFRSASWAERETLIPFVFKGNPELKPEIIKTTEMQFFYRTQLDFYTVNIFYSEITDIHSLDNTVVPTPTLFNQGKLITKGGELEWYTNPSDKWVYAGNLSWQTNKASDGKRDARLLPTWLAKMSIQYSISSAINLGLYDIYTPAVENEDAIKTNPDSKSFHNLTLNMQFSMEKLLKLRTESKHTVSLHLTNILEDDPLYQPGEFLGSAVNTLPWREGRGAYLVYGGQW